MRSAAPPWHQVVDVSREPAAPPAAAPLGGENLLPEPLPAWREALSSAHAPIVRPGTATVRRLLATASPPHFGREQKWPRASAWQAFARPAAIRQSQLARGSGGTATDGTVAGLRMVGGDAPGVSVLVAVTGWGGVRGQSRRSVAVPVQRHRSSAPSGCGDGSNPGGVAASTRRSWFRPTAVARRARRQAPAVGAAGWPPGLCPSGIHVELGDPAAQAGLVTFLVVDLLIGHDRAVLLDGQVVRARQLFRA